jgi:hypothetical protein
VGGACGANGKKRNVYRVLVIRSEGERPLGRPRHRCMDNIEMKNAIFGDVTLCGSF